MNLKDMLDAFRKGQEHQPLAPLDTIWGESLDVGHVLEEYPRPQLVRNNYEILNGYWRYAITSRSNKRPKKFDGLILVPFSPESQLSGVGRQLKPDEYLWYERTIDIPDYSSETRKILHFEAVDQCACVYINGHAVTRHVGGYLPFEADISSWLKEGRNRIRLTVRVQDFSDTSWHTRGKQKLTPGGMYYTAQSGIWQTVWMETVPKNYIAGLEIRPNPDKKQISVSVLPYEFSRTPVMQVKIFEPTDSFDADTVSPRTPIMSKTYGDCHAVMNIPDIKLWTPQTPWLYPIEITLGSDTVTSYFAMRSFSVEKDSAKIPRICLNHRPIFVNGVLDQGYWPDGLYTAPSDEALVYDIAKMKDMGFNMLRKHAKIESRRWYYHCDRLGMLVWQDMVNGGAADKPLLVTYLPTFTSVPGPSFKKKPSDQRTRSLPPFIRHWMYSATGRRDVRSREEYLYECMETVELLKPFPSIMTWVLFNEGWGQFDTPFIEHLIRSLDEERLIDAASGWFDCGHGNFKSVHNYFSKPAPVHDYRPYVLSEYGGYTYHAKGHSCTEEAYGYHNYASSEEYDAAVKRLLTHDIKKRIADGLCGAVYTQLSDIEEELNGLLTYDRRVCKLSEATIASIRKELQNETEL